MNKFLRKRGKMMMAIFGALLMVAFSVPTSCQMGPGRPTEFGSMYNGEVKLTAAEYRRLLADWQVLKEGFPGAVVLALGQGLVQGDPMDPMGRTKQMLGYQYFQQISENEELWVLLAKEAERNGVAVSTDTVESFLTTGGASKETDPQAYERLKGPITTLLTVAASADRAASVAKVSQPSAAAQLAQRGQDLAVNVVEFDAKDLLDQVPAPTPEQVQAHYDKHKSVEPGEGKGAFGYKHPNRVKYEAVVIRKDEVKKGIKSVEPEEAAEYYVAHRSEYVSTTGPSTRPEDQFNIDRGPTTRQQPFSEVKDRIVQKLTDQRVDELTEKIRDAVRERMRADFEAYRAATAPATAGAATKPAPVTPLGVPYDSKEYLAKLRDKVQADHKVTLTIEREEGWQSAKTLAESRLGKEAFGGGAEGPFGQFLTSRVGPFLTEEQRKAAPTRGNMWAAAWEPTPAFTNAKDDVLIARVTAADPAHAPASLDEVRDRVVADVRQAAAYDKAKQAAQAMLDAAKNGKWLQSVANEQNRKMITTGAFQLTAGQTGVPNYDLKGAAAEAFVQGAYKLLSQATPRGGGEAPRPVAPPATTQTSTTQKAGVAATRPTTAPAAAATTKAAAPTSAPVSTAFKDYPIGLIELPAEGKVTVVEVDQLKPRWTKDSAAMQAAWLAGMERSRMEQELRAQWFNFDNVLNRVGYRYPEGQQRKAPRQTLPINPFTGTAGPL
jgi:hypothetical protein